MTEAMPFLRKVNITFLCPPDLTAEPFGSKRGTGLFYALSISERVASRAEKAASSSVVEKNMILMR